MSTNAIEIARERTERQLAEWKAREAQLVGAMANDREVDPDEVILVLEHTGTTHDELQEKADYQKTLQIEQSRYATKDDRKKAAADAMAALQKAEAERAAAIALHDKKVEAAKSLVRSTASAVAQLNVIRKRIIDNAPQSYRDERRELADERKGILENRAKAATEVETFRQLIEGCKRRLNEDPKNRELIEAELKTAERRHAEAVERHTRIVASVKRIDDELQRMEDELLTG